MRGAASKGSGVPSPPAPIVHRSSRLELGAALTLTALAVGFHIAFLLSAGPLWRDEANSVNLASMPSVGEIWNNLQFDSFPALWPLVLRAWMGSGFGATDSGLRVLGLLAGLLVLAALWSHARTWGGLPLASLSLFAVNAAVIRYGDSVRGFGFGMASVLLAIGLIWSASTAPTRRTILMASFAAVLSVQFLYQNAIILGAACAGGVAVALARRSLRSTAAVVGVGFVAALSLLPYVVVFGRQAEWGQILQLPIGFFGVWLRFQDSMASSGPAAPWILLCGAVSAVAVGVASRARSEQALFCTTALATGTVVYVAILRALNYFLQPWYFLSLFALLATCLDGVVASRPRPARLPWLRAAAAAAIAGLAVLPVWGYLRTRASNYDVVVREIARIASPADLVVVNPWQAGITFQRYYSGTAPWDTVPPMPDHRLHRFDLLKGRMMDPEAMRPLLQKLELTLREGHRVFWVGKLELPDGRDPVPLLPPAPQGPWGWREAPHSKGWRLQAGEVLLRYGKNARVLAVATELPVMFYENPRVVIVEGVPTP